MRKVKIIPYWDGGTFETRRFLVDALPEMAESEVCLAGTLLGVLLGPEAAHRVTTPAATKYWHRALEARALMTNFKHSLRHYAVFAFPVLSYIIQYAAVPPDVLAQEARALQLLTRTPWNSIPPEALMHLKDMHFMYEAPSIARTALAAAFRAAVKSPAFLRLRDAQEPPDDDLEQLLYPRTPEWTLHSPMTHLINVFNRVNHLYPGLSPDPLSNIQHRLNVMIREHAESPWFDIFSRRLRRFAINLKKDDFENILCNFKFQGNEAGDRRRWATILISFNALPTAARMQSSSRQCLTCNSADDDRVEHLVHCPAFAPVLARLFPELCLAMGPALGCRRTVGALPLNESDARASFLFNLILTETHRLKRHGDCTEVFDTALAVVRADARRGGRLAAEQ
jgi:hypothetical protein